MPEIICKKTVLNEQVNCNQKLRKVLFFLIWQSLFTCRVELDKLHILTGQASSGHHGVSISGASVGRCAAEIGSSITSGEIKNTIVTKSELKRMNLLCN